MFVESNLEIKQKTSIFKRLYSKNNWYNKKKRLALIILTEFQAALNFVLWILYITRHNSKKFFFHEKIKIWFKFGQHA